MRTKACIHSLSGHTNTIADLFTQASDPQVLNIVIIDIFAIIIMLYRLVNSIK